MTHKSELPDNFMSQINNRLEAERVAAGDFLFDLIDSNELIRRCKEKELARANIMIFLLEQAGAQPRITTNLRLEVQKEGIKKMGMLLCTRFFKTACFAHLYSHAKVNNSKWLEAIADILAREMPTAYLNVLALKPDGYMISEVSDKAMKSFFVDSLCEEGRLNVAREAKKKGKLPMLMKTTGWDACKTLMKKGNNRRILLTLEMGL
jgi:hypothetical protein